MRVEVFSYSSVASLTCAANDNSSSNLPIFLIFYNQKYQYEPTYKKTLFKFCNNCIYYIVLINISHRTLKDSK